MTLMMKKLEEHRPIGKCLNPVRERKKLRLNTLAEPVVFRIISIPSLITCRHKYLDGFRSRSLQRHLALDGRTEAADKPTFDTTYKPLLILDRIDQRKQWKKERSGSFNSSESESDSESDLDRDTPKKSSRKKFKLRRYCRHLRRRPSNLARQHPALPDHALRHASKQ